MEASTMDAMAVYNNSYVEIISLFILTNAEVIPH